MSDIKDVLDGFNSGYIIRNRKPELYKQLAEQVEKVDLTFFTSFKDGGRECEKDYIRQLMTQSDITKTHSSTIDMDRDHKDPDKEIHCK